MHGRISKVWLGALLAVAAALGAGCEAGRNKLLADLQSPRPEVRALAVRKLAAGDHPEDLVLFTHAAKDVSFLVREEAAAALGRSQDLRVVDLLGELLEDPDQEVQAKAALALAEIKSDKAKSYLTLQYGRRGRSTRIAIVQALKLANVPDAMSTVVQAEAKAIWDRNLQALEEGSLAERVGAAEELGRSGRPDAITRLQELVRDSPVLLKAAAIRGLGYSGQRSLAPDLLPLLGEASPEVREAAIQALQHLQAPTAVAPLLKLALDKQSSSEIAAEALIAFTPSPEVAQALCHIALEGSDVPAAEAAQAMRSRGGCPADQLTKSLSRSTLAATLTAIAWLGPTAAQTAPQLIPFLNDRDPHIRLLALRAVGAIRATTAAPAVQKAFVQEQQALAPLRAKWITAALPARYLPGFGPQQDGPEAAAERESDLMHQVQANTDAKVIAQGGELLRHRAPGELVDDLEPQQLAGFATAALALAQVQAPEAFHELQGLIGDPAPSVRAAALAGLAYLGPKGLAVARLGVFDSDRQVQGQVVQALADQGEPGIVTLVEAGQKLTGDRTKLLEALADRPLPDAAGELLKAAVARGGAEAVMAADMLGQMRDKGAVDALMKALEDPTNVARRSMLLALGRIGDSRAESEIALDLYSDTPDVRSAAAEALAQLGVQDQAEPLKALRNDYYRRVRESAEMALNSGGGAVVARPN